MANKFTLLPCLKRSGYSLTNLVNKATDTRDTNMQETFPLPALTIASYVNQTNIHIQVQVKSHCFHQYFQRIKEKKTKSLNTLKSFVLKITPTMLGGALQGMKRQNITSKETPFSNYHFKKGCQL